MSLTLGIYQQAQILTRHRSLAVNPRNTQCIPIDPAMPCEIYNSNSAVYFIGVGPVDRVAVAKILAFLELKQKYQFFKGLHLWR